MKKKNFFTSLLSSLKKKKNSTSYMVIGVLVLIILLGGFYYFRGQFVSVMVNGQPIWRLTLIRELERQAGSDTLETLITKTLILQEAGKQGISISPEELDEKIKELEDNFTSQGQDLDQLLEAQGMTRAQLREQIEIQLMINKIVGEEVEVSDEEVDEYLEANREYFPEADSEETRVGIKDQLEQEKLNEKIQSWLDSLREEAQISYL